MVYRLKEDIRGKARVRRQKSWWRRGVSVVAAVVVFCTTYALILPAITLDRPNFCGMEEHTHGPACYQVPQTLTCQVEGPVLHTHEEICYDSQGNLICTLPELLPHTHGPECYAFQEGHTHDESCYGKTRELICGLEETPGHTHDESCRGQEQVLVCTLEESPDHTHGEGCYESVTRCICPLEEHVHGESCFGEDGSLVCTQQEHTHADGCWETTRELICQEVESPGHTHGPECYETWEVFLCGKEEGPGHVHTDACYRETETLICNQEEREAGEVLICPLEERQAHTHGPACYDETGALVCKLPEIGVHQHGPECLGPVPGGEPELICGLPEHTHSDSCRTDPTADLETAADWEATLPGEKTGEWGPDILAVAKSQLGYRESTCNLEFQEDGQVKGITRYGQWAGDPYGDWCGYFVDFCRHYAGVPAEAFPIHPGQSQWCPQLEQENWGIYWTPQVYTPEPGDRIYFDMDGNGAQDHVGLVEKWIPAEGEQEAQVCTIEGNAGNQVQQLTYPASAPEILGYASVAAARERYDRLTAGEVPEYLCGKEPHTHGEGCYDENGSLICTLEEHTHSEACLVPPEPEYICGKEAHTHGPECCDENGNLICTLEEHTHSEACLVPPEPEYICGKEAHTHGPACYDENGNLICTLEEHTHSEACLVPPEPEYICGKEAHTHGPGCYDESGNLICTLEEHIHDESCLPPQYLCGQEAHLHQQSCYDETGALICGKQEHIHTDACLGYLCGFQAHTHGPECYDGEGNLTCALQEHTHTPECKNLLTGAVFRQVSSLSELTPEESYLMVAQDPQTGESRLLSAGQDGQVEVSAGVDESGQRVAQLSVAGSPLSPDQPEAMESAYLWAAPMAQPLAEEGQSITLENQGDADIRSDVTQTQDQQLQAVKSQLDMESLEKVPLSGVETVTLFAAGPIEKPNENILYCDKCLNGDYANCSHYKKILNFADPSGTFPFGGAQEFNAFLLGDMDNWGTVHGNAAVAGNIIGKNKSITYDEKSSGDYSGESVPRFEIGLLVGGERLAAADSAETPSKLYVHNGDVLGQSEMAKSLDMVTVGNPQYYHIIPKEKIARYFTEAATELKARNVATDQYCDGLGGTDEHKGTLRQVTEQVIEEYEKKYPAVKGSLTGTEHDFLFTGTNSTYNVLNLNVSELEANGTAVDVMQIYLDIPFSSYLLINVTDDRTATTSTPNISFVLRYKDSKGVFIPQPADSSANDDYTQTQRTMVNFDPTLTDVNFTTAGQFLYASILAPHTNFHVPNGSSANIMGTFVANSLEDADNNSNILYNPFYAGAQVTLTKSVHCDDTTHTAGTCFICEENAKETGKWDGYYADLTLTSVDEYTGSVRIKEVSKLPLNGGQLTIEGLSPGTYRIAKEEVYTLDEGGNKIPVDYADQKTWNGHSFVGAYFAGGNTTFTVKAGQFLSLEVENHYDVGDFVTVPVRKAWKDAAGNTLKPPAGASVQIALMQSTDGKDWKQYGEPVTLSDANAWFHSFRGLPKADENGNAYRYEPREYVGWPGFSSKEAVQEPDTGIYVLENEEDTVTGIEVVKSWMKDETSVISPETLLLPEGQEDIYQNGYTRPSVNMHLFYKEGKYPAVTDGMRTATITVKISDTQSVTYKAVPGSKLDLHLNVYTYQENGGNQHTTNDFSIPGVKLTMTVGGFAHDCSVFPQRQYFEKKAIISIPSVAGDMTLTLVPKEGIIFPTGNLGQAYDIPPLKVDENATVQELPASMIQWGDWRSANGAGLLPQGESADVTLPKQNSTQLVRIEEEPVPTAEIKLDAKAAWTHSWKDLPTADAKTGVYYRYMVFEEPVEGYTTSYRLGTTIYEGAKITADSTGVFTVDDSLVTVNGTPAKIPGIESGRIFVRNIDVPTGPELPATGGPGTALYTLGGLTLLLTAVPIYTHKTRKTHKKPRKGEGS